MNGTLQVSLDHRRRTLVVSANKTDVPAAISEVQYTELTDHINEADRLVIKLAEAEVPVVDYRLRPLHEDELFDDYILLSLIPGVTLRHNAKLPLTQKEG
ncbi:MAG: hypothetical protein EPN30_11470 [Actinomycetota bacterium]|nr:MAG: hypothetical protein EPN30_11470 [Actinomycetota bacterium]